MVKYFIPKKVTPWLDEKISNYKYKNDYNKTVMEFDNSSMNTEHQIFHNIMKLKNSVSGEIYSSEIDSCATYLLNALRTMKDNVLEIKEEAEPMLIKAIEYCYNQKRLFVEHPDKHISDAMMTNYRMQYESYAFLTKLDENTDVDAIKKALEKKLAPLKPINNFKAQIEESKGKRLTFSAWIGDLRVEAPIENITITDKNILIEIPYGFYKLEKNIRSSIHKVDSRDMEIYSNYEWIYNLRGNGEATVGLQKRHNKIL